MLSIIISVNLIATDSVELPIKAMGYQENYNSCKVS
jgi:hypothetical protein